jgi:hypothetical protein
MPREKARAGGSGRQEENMAKKGYNELVGRMVNDAAFRAEVLSSPRDVLVREGFKVGDDVVEQLEAIDLATAEKVVKSLEKKFGTKSAI